MAMDRNRHCREALHNAPSAVVIAADIGDRIAVVYANTAAQALLNIADIDGDLSDLALFVTTPGAGPDKAWRAAVSEGQTTVLRGAARHPVRGDYWLEVRVQPLAADPATAALYLSPAAKPGRAVSDIDFASAALDATAAELAARDAELTALMAAYPGLVMLLDVQFGVRGVAGASLRDIAPKPTASPDTLLEAVGADVANAVIPFAEDALTGKRTRFELIVMHRRFEGVAAPISPAGQPDGVMIALHDVTDLRAAFAVLADERGASQR